jgi:two-component system response regulator PilR (NtrC family)
VVLGQEEELNGACLPPQLQNSGLSANGSLSEIPETGLDLDAYLGGIEKDILLKALDKTGGVRKKAAELLGITFRSIRYRLAKFGIDPDGEE